MLLWVDLEEFSTGAAGALRREFDLDQESINRLDESAGSAFFHDGGDYVHLSAYVPDTAATNQLVRLECIAGERWVITAHQGRSSALDAFAERVTGSGQTGEMDGPSFLATLLEWLLNEFVLAFERIEQDLEDFDARAMRGDISRSPEDQIEYLVQRRSRVGQLRRALLAHREPFLALAHPELEAIGDSRSADRFMRLFDRFNATLQAARDVRESIVSSFDVLIARTGHRTNEIVKVLTLASVMFLPGALLAGVLGMNFHVGLFDHPEGFWVASGVIVAFIAATLATAKLRRWI